MESGDQGRMSSAEKGMVRVRPQQVDEDGGRRCRAAAAKH